ncbi:MAG: FlgD immunoglobulin-like domain containing protein [FCB group bacterium]|jgi:hypothetical protein
MKNLSVYLLIAGLILAAGVIELTAQQDVKLDRSVIGSGGTVGSTNSNNVKMSGITGQLAIEKRTGTTNDLYQGFWVPVGNYLVGVNDNTSSDNGKISNYPNPFNTSTTIKYNLQYSGNVTLKIYDVQGNIVKFLVNEPQVNGDHEISWNGKNDLGVDLASGTYLYELTVTSSMMTGVAGSNTATMRNMLIIVR